MAKELCNNTGNCFPCIETDSSISAADARGLYGCTQVEAGKAKLASPKLQQSIRKASTPEAINFLTSIGMLSSASGRD